MAGGSHTVFEFTGSEADKEHRGSRGTFMGATLDLAPAREEREHNLGSGSGTWIFAGVAVLLVGGIAAYMALSGPKDEPETETEPAVAAAPAEPAAPDAKAEDAKAAEPAAPAAEDAKAPADDAKADAPKPAEPVVEPPAEPKPTKSTGSKSTGSKSTGSKSTGGKSTGGKTSGGTKPKEDPKPSTGGKTLKPKKPPRGLGDLPPPPG